MGESAHELESGEGAGVGDSSAESMGAGVDDEETDGGKKKWAVGEDVRGMARVQDFFGANENFANKVWAEGFC